MPWGASSHAAIAPRWRAAARSRSPTPSATLAPAPTWSSFRSRRSSSALQLATTRFSPMAGTQTLGRYRLERVLGKGAMGLVYEALDPKLQRKVAIKTIRINQLDEETAKDFSMRVERQARAGTR